MPVLKVKQNDEWKVLTGIVDKASISPEDIGALNIDLTDADAGQIPKTNSDQLGGVDADQYALKTDLENVEVDLAEYYTKSEIDEKIDSNLGVTKITFSYLLAANAWSAETPFTQTITVEGIGENDRPHIFLDLSAATADTVEALEENWNLVKYADASNGQITFSCIAEAPTIDLPIEGEVVVAEVVYENAAGSEF